MALFCQAFFPVAFLSLSCFRCAAPGTDKELAISLRRNPQRTSFRVIDDALVSAVQKRGDDGTQKLYLRISSTQITIFKHLLTPNLDGTELIECNKMLIYFTERRAQHLKLFNARPFHSILSAANNFWE